MPVSQTKKLEIASRRAQVAQLYLHCTTQHDIAHQLRISQTTVSSDLKAVHKQWRESTVHDLDAAKQLELRRLDLLERQAWQAWQRSQQPLEETRVQTDSSNKKRAEKSVKQVHGDPRYLEVILKCSASRRALMGLDAPAKIAPTTPDGKPLSFDQRKIHIQAILTEQLGLATIQLGEKNDG